VCLSSFPHSSAYFCFSFSLYRKNSKEREFISFLHLATNHPWLFLFLAADFFSFFFFLCFDRASTYFCIIIKLSAIVIIFSVSNHILHESIEADYNRHQKPLLPSYLRALITTTLACIFFFKNVICSCLKLFQWILTLMKSYFDLCVFVRSSKIQATAPTFDIDKQDILGDRSDLVIRFIRKTTCKPP